MPCKREQVERLVAHDSLRWKQKERGRAVALLRERRLHQGTGGVPLVRHVGVRGAFPDYAGEKQTPDRGGCGSVHRARQSKLRFLSKASPFPRDHCPRLFWPTNSPPVHPRSPLVPPATTVVVIAARTGPHKMPAVMDQEALNWSCNLVRDEATVFVELGLCRELVDQGELR